MPIFNLDLTFNKLKSKLIQYFWEHFLNHLDVSNNCTLHYQCPCSGCHQSKSPTINLTQMFVCKHMNLQLIFCSFVILGCWYRLPAVLWYIYIVNKANNNNTLLCASIHVQLIDCHLYNKLTFYIRTDCGLIYFVHEAIGLRSKNTGATYYIAIPGRFLNYLGLFVGIGIKSQIDR